MKKVLKLNNGLSIPVLGLGTYKVSGNTNNCLVFFL